MYKVPKFGNSLLANTTDVLNGTGYSVDVMILHYHLTFYNELSGKSKCVARIPNNKGNEKKLKLCEHQLEIFEVFNFHP